MIYISKELHIWFNANYPKNTLHLYKLAMDAVKNSVSEIHTTQTELANLRFIKVYGYRLFVHTYTGEAFEVTLGACARTTKEIRPAHNLEKMLLNGAFDVNEGDVTGIDYMIEKYPDYVMLDASKLSEKEKENFLNLIKRPRFRFDKIE